MVQTVEKQVEYQDAVANKFLQKYGGSQQKGDASGKTKRKSKDGAGGLTKQEGPSSQLVTPLNDTLNDRESRSNSIVSSNQMGAFKSGIALENALRNHRKSNKPPVLEQN